MCSVRRGHLLDGGVERLHGMRSRDVPGLDGRVELRELLGGLVLGGRSVFLCELRGGHLPRRERVIRLRGLRRRDGVRKRGGVAIGSMFGVSSR